MSEPVDGYRPLAAALAIGFLTGGAGGSLGTYKVADDYNKDIMAQAIEIAVGKCRDEFLEYRLNHLESRQ